MNTELQGFMEIFADRLFRIPDYQRGYSWEEQQLRDFWDDLVNLPENKSHYTGMLSIQRVPEDIASTWNEESWLFEDVTEGNIKPYYVVDGQQRLTTFLILAECFCEHLRSSAGPGKDDSEIYLFDNTTTLEKVVKTCIKIIKPTGLLTAYKFGYDRDNPTFKFFRHCVFNESNPGMLKDSLYTHNLKNAKAFFEENIKQLAYDNGEATLESVFNKLLNNMKLNVHEIDNEFDVFAAFETMNNRGKKLSNLELLKSRLIYLTSLLPLDEDEESSLRNEINDCWKEIYYQLGRNKNSLPDDDFLRDHWLISYQYSGKRGEDYASFLLGEEFTLKNIASMKSAVSICHDDKTSYPILYADNDPAADEEDLNDPLVTEAQDLNTDDGRLTALYIKEYVLSMKTAARWWYATFYPDDETELTDNERKWLRRLGRLGFVYFRPLIVASFVSEGTAATDREALLKEVERFIFIVFRMSGTYSSFNRNNTYAMARHVATGELSVIEAAEQIRDKIKSWYSPSGLYDHRDFENRLHRLFNSGNKEGFYGWSGLRYLLYEYEEHLVDERGNAQKQIEYFTLSRKDKISVEHILPQAATNPYWQEKFGHCGEDELRRLTGSLGNLVLLSMEINTKLQNDSFPEKKKDKRDGQGKLVRRGYRTGSHSENEIASDYEDWTPSSILQRGIQLLTFLEQRWDVKFQSEETKRELLHIDL